VVQIQRNAFFPNWLKASAGARYRPYEERRQAFSDYLEQIDRFVREEGGLVTSNPGRVW